MSQPHRATDADAERIVTAHTETKALRAQLRRIERTLESVLTSDALTDAQRRELLGLLAGTRGGPHTRPAVNPGAEHQLIEHYRRLTTNDKTLISRLCARFADRTGAA